jgi:hypothetical protein
MNPEKQTTSFQSLVNLSKSNEKFEFDGISSDQCLLPRSDFDSETYVARLLVVRANVKFRTTGEECAPFYFVTASEDWRDHSRIIQPYHNANTEFGLTGRTGLAGAVTAECGRAIEYLRKLHAERMFK